MGSRKKDREPDTHMSHLFLQSSPYGFDSSRRRTVIAAAGCLDDTVSCNRADLYIPSADMIRSAVRESEQAPEGKNVQDSCGEPSRWDRLVSNRTKLPDVRKTGREAKLSCIAA
jgi:hypothetical protein